MRPGFWSWHEWRLGIGRFKGGKPRDPKTRPHVPLRIPKAWWKHYLRLLEKKQPAPTPPPPPTPVTRLHMFDDVSLSLIPKNAEAVAGYVGGRWPNYPQAVSGWPHAKHLSIAVASSYDADCLDVEPGDATIAVAPAWVKRQIALRKQGHKYNTSKPVLYTSASWGAALIDACSKAGLRYGIDYRWWSAHYNPALGEHFCGPKCGYGLKHTAHATQFTDKAFGRSLDESVCSPGFFT